MNHARICHDLLRIVRIEKGPDFPSGDGLVIWAKEPLGTCAGEKGCKSAVVAGWLASQTEGILLPAGSHRLLRITLEPAAGDPLGTCSRLELSTCLGHPVAPVRPLITGSSGESIRLLVEGATVCLEEPCSVRGDANEDGRFDISDPVRILTCLFLDPDQCPDCLDRADADDSGLREITDAIYLLVWRFGDGSEPPAPFPSCGADTTADGLRCFPYELRVR